jgi:hypothetical protein
VVHLRKLYSFFFSFFLIVIIKKKKTNRIIIKDVRRPGTRTYRRENIYITIELIRGYLCLFFC